MQFNIPAEFKNASGVYIIRNSVNSKVYVGSARDFYKRYLGHRSHLRRGKHSSRHMQRHHDKHGIEAFSFNLLELVADNAHEILAIESKHIAAFNAANPSNGFNNMPASLPARHSEETKDKLRGLLAGYMTPEVLAKRKAGQLAAAQRKTEERMARRAICRFCGKEFMPPLWKSIDKAKFCSHECSTKYPVSEETRAKQREQSTGRKRSAESIEKSRKGRIGRGDLRSAEGKERTRLATAARMQGQSEEQKDVHRARLARPDIIEKRIAALKAKGPHNKRPEYERQRTCQCCGNYFLVDYPARVRLFCSRICYQAAKPPLSQAQGAGLAKRQARRADAASQSWCKPFLAALTAGALVENAVKKAGVNLATVYRYRKSDINFAAQWQQARL